MSICAIRCERTRHTCVLAISLEINEGAIELLVVGGGGLILTRCLETIARTACAGIVQRGTAVTGRVLDGRG